VRHTCPHCRQPSLPGRSVRGSSRGAPCTCPHCARLSHVLASTSGGIVGLTVFGLVLAIVAGTVWSSVVLAAGLVLLVACVNRLMWRRVELWPISREAARRSARVSLLAFLR